MGYAYYRVSMTVSIMFFIVMIMVFYSMPVLTPVMFILPALLDDVPVMLIAFDNAKISPTPSKWDMRKVMIISSILALIRVVQSASLLRYLHHELGMQLPQIQTAMFMQLVIAGHLLLFSTRARGFFFQKPWPDGRFFLAIMGTQVFAAFMASQGWRVTPISWELIGKIWLYNLCWLLVIDLAKIAIFRQLEEGEAGGSRWSNVHRALDPFGGRLGKVR